MDPKLKVWLQLLLSLAITFVFFYMMAPFMVAILLGAVTAIVWYPLHSRLLRILNKNFSALLITLLVTFGIVVPLVFVLYSSIQKLALWISTFKIPQGDLHDVLKASWALKLMNYINRFTPIDEEWLQTQGRELLQLLIEKSTKFITISLSSMPGFLLALFVVIISIFFFLRDGDKFLRFLSKLSPLAQKRTKELYSSFETSCRGVVMGLFLSAVVQGTLVTLIFLICGVPNPFFFGIASIVLGMVPVVGCSPIWVGGALFLLLQNDILWGSVALAGGLVVTVSDNIVRPWVMSGHSEMHPLLALVSVFGAVSLMGPMGIFLGPIIAAVFVSFLKIVSSEITTGS